MITLFIRICVMVSFLVCHLTLFSRPSAQLLLDSIPFPWSAVSLTDVRMKPFYVAVITDQNGFPFLPVIGGVVGTGVLVYILTKDEKTEDCTFTASAQTTASSCGLANGSIVITTNVEATYQWSNGSTSKDQLGIAAGNYAVTITRKGTSCTQILQATITNADPPITTTITTQDAACGQSNGSATPSVDPSGSYTFLWSNGSMNQNLENVPTGTYTLTVTATGTCQDVSTATIGELPPAFNINIATTSAHCGINDGTATVNVDPPDTYIYLWSNGATTSQITNASAGTYTVTVTLAGSNCSSSASTTIAELPPTFVITSATTPSNCGATDGTATLVVEPDGTYTFVWPDGQTTAQAVGLSSGTHTVTVTLSGTMCSKTLDVIVDQRPPSFTLTATTTSATCGLSDGTATVVVDPPDEYSYLWPDGQTTSQATSLGAGIYSVTVTIPGTSCSKSIEAFITELQASYTVSTTTTPSGCGQSTGTATAVADPPAEYTYQWSDGQVGAQAVNLSPGQYIVSVSPFGSSCIVTDTIRVVQVTPTFTETISTVPADCGLNNGSAMIIIDPAGSYTYQWSNQQSGPALQNVMAGSYAVIVTDINACTASFLAEIIQNPAEYIEIISSVPATCIGGGEISFTLSTPGPGLLQVEIISPEGTTSLLLAPGSYLLSSFVNVLPGTYTLNVFDQGIGQSCFESQSTTIVDQTPALNIVNDFYFTVGEQPVIENMLGNDSGLGLLVTAISNAIGGAVVFNGNGAFTYTPNPGFSGDGSFTYTVTDACGNTGTGIVTITVEMVACNFTISTTLIPAHCGLSDGYINVEVNEAGSYSYFWSTGLSGPELEDVPADVYGLTITDINLGCFLEFEIELTEYPAEYIENVVTTQPTCSAPGEILIEVTAPGSQDVLTMNISHPNGTDVFEIDPGTVLLSDYVDITPGTYTIEFSIGNVGSECVDEFTVTINMPSLLEIQAEAVFPPSSPPAMDGSAIIVVLVPGTLPYTVFVDGLAVATANANTFTIGGMGVGTHTIQIRDANGCFSNLLIIQIPFPDIILSFGTVISSLSPDADGLERVNIPSGSYWCNSLLATLKYHTRDVPQQFRFLYTPVSVNRSSFSEFLLETEHRSQLGCVTKKKYKLRLEGGLGVRFWSSAFMKNPSPYLGLSGSGEIRLGKIAYLQIELGLTGWKQIDQPQWRVIANFPFLH